MKVMPLGAARDIAGRVDLPLPVWLFVLAAALVLVVSFVALGAFWTTPRLQTPRTARRTRPILIDIVLGGFGIGVFALTILSGLGGTPAPSASFATNLVYVDVWVGLVAASVLLGDVFSLLSPWRSVARAARWGAARVGVQVRPARPYPRRLGYWPAVLGVLVFAWLEVAYSGAADPRFTAVVCVVYFGLQLVGMAVSGIEVWSERGDALGVLFGLMGRCAPVDLTGRALSLRRPLTGFAQTPLMPGLTVLACVPIAATTFDAFTATGTWRTRTEPWLVGVFFDRGAGIALGRDLGATVALLLALLTIVAVFGGAVLIMRATSHDVDLAGVGRLLAVSLLPIAAAYVLANGLSLLLDQSQTSVALASDPLSREDNLFATAQWQTHYGLLSPVAVWYVQVAVLLIGHVLGLILAHERLLLVVPDPGRARRMQCWMLAAMVIYTTLALALLAAIST